MSDLLDKIKDKLTPNEWTKDKVDPGAREWEDFYRSRYQYDKIVRSTHGVNCTGSCSWDVYVKNGLITWEMQAVDYPLLDSSVPPYEPRGCQRGITASWYVYSPLRVKYPYVRGNLLDFWREAKEEYGDPLKAYEAVVSDPDKRSAYQNARGKGGFRRVSWDEVQELISMSLISTIKKYGPDRIFGFTPIPAMSYLSYAAGSRFIQLLGGVGMSFYDWYSDLPNAFPEVWGEQTDVAESADWFNSKYVIAMGSNISITRCPDAHFIHEGRHQGAKFVTICPDFSATAKNSDWWIPVHPGQDTAMWMAINHVILTEFYVDKQVDYFTEYVKQYSDSPFLVELEEVKDGVFKSGKMLRADQLPEYTDIENPDWKLVVFDDNTESYKLPNGSLGNRWADEETGNWNLRMEDSQTDEKLNPRLSLLENREDVLSVAFDDFNNETSVHKEVPVKYIEDINGDKIAVTTVLDLLFAQFSVKREGLSGDYPEDYDDKNALYTPAWQEEMTGIGRKTVIKLAREFATNAEKTEGKSMVIIGTGVNHWYHNNLGYRGPITALIMTGCVGRNGGGLNHYVGQEKVALITPWANVAMALDWEKPPRLQQTPIWHYMHSGQWRYEGPFSDYAALPEGSKFDAKHTADLIVNAVKMGWMPFFPQFNKSPLEVVTDAKESGAESDDEIVDYIVDSLQSGELQFAVEDIDAEENFPRVWFIWRANALASSAKGHDFFMKHYLGTDSNIILDEIADEYVEDVNYREEAPTGKMDLVIDLNFRMDTSALYSDIVLPAAMWYEKNDLNTTDLHTFIHPLGEAVPPAWEAKSDYDIFKTLAKSFTDHAETYLPDPVTDVKAMPLGHDSPAEMAQPEVKNWAKGECEPIPGKTMPNFKVIERDYTKVYDKFIAFGRRSRDDGFGIHGIPIPIKDEYDKLLENPVGGTKDTKHMRCVEIDGVKYPSLETDLDAANLILRLAPETNGDIAYAAFESEEKKTNLELTDLAERTRSYRVNFEDITSQPRRVLTTPSWTGIANDGRPYAGFTLNVEKLVPWRTLSGRQSLYLDHPNYQEFGETLPTYKPKIKANEVRELSITEDEEESIELSFQTFHGKWQIHSTFYDNEKMRTLSRPIEPCWMHPDDADKIGVEDHDWIEVYNDNGVVVSRAAVSSRVPKGYTIMHHSTERTIGLPKAQIRGKNQRGGIHNSLIRVRLNPLLLTGGYAQFSYGFNYWGPVGVNRDTYVRVRKLDKIEY